MEWTGVKVWTMALCGEMFDHDINAFTEPDFHSMGLEGQVKSGAIAQAEVASDSFSVLKKRYISTF